MSAKPKMLAMLFVNYQFCKLGIFLRNSYIKVRLRDRQHLLHLPSRVWADQSGHGCFVYKNIVPISRAREGNNDIKHVDKRKLNKGP